jgi:hypothetical protein
MGHASPPCSLICETVRSHNSNRLAATITVAPSWPNRRAIALPIPLLLPVTIATLFFSRSVLIMP